MLYFVEYMSDYSGISVDCTVGCASKLMAIQHGRMISTKNRYTGFWVSHKPEQAGVDPIRIEFHPISYSPDGKPVFGEVVR